MDLQTIRKRLDSTYKSREDFVVDVRQIFDNCEIFNEDDSPVGKAGHNMRTYFESRWAEVTGAVERGEERQGGGGRRRRAYPFLVFVFLCRSRCPCNSKKKKEKLTHTHTHASTVGRDCGISDS
ncbi:unnamed protein product [Notodromas monacha]|uniref:Bromo domain-containing protein n=1 Tax=Notodromas monacha TaxID=399045 RepID=A0A7R9GJ69_9CRUS|nr:unnamed protein product [Notodromas monacha]CAG0922552.1 unnamed protein product [Notodromas monacha]